MVVVSPPGAALGVAAGPVAPVYRVDAGGDIRELLGGEQFPDLFLIDAPLIQRGVGAVPATAMDPRQAKVNRRNNRAGRQDLVDELEEGVGASTEASVKPPAELPDRYGRLGAVAYLPTPVVC